jgi:hypothetical protein
MRGIRTLALFGLLLACPLGRAAENPQLKLAGRGLLEDLTQDQAKTSGTITLRNMRDQSVQFQVTPETEFQQVLGTDRRPSTFSGDHLGKPVVIFIQPAAPKVAARVDVLLDPRPVPGVLISLDKNDENGNTANLTLKGAKAEDLVFRVHGNTLFEALQDNKRSPVDDFADAFDETYKGQWAIVYPQGKGVAARVEILLGNRPRDLTPAALETPPLGGVILGTVPDSNGDGGMVRIDNGSGEIQTYPVPVLAPYTRVVGQPVLMLPSGGGVPTFQVYPPYPLAGQVVRVVPNGNGPGGVVRVRNYRGIHSIRVNNVAAFKNNKRPLVIYPQAGKAGPVQVANNFHVRPPRPRPFGHRPVGKAHPKANAKKPNLHRPKVNPPKSPQANPNVKKPPQHTPNPNVKKPPTHNPSAKKPPQHTPKPKKPPQHKPNAKKPPKQSPNAKKPPQHKPNAKKPPQHKPAAKNHPKPKQTPKPKEKPKAKPKPKPKPKPKEKPKKKK